MPRKKKSRVVRAVPPSTAPPREIRSKPQIETVVVHTTRERKRNASGGALGEKAGSAFIPVLGGLAGGTAAVIATQKWNAHPGLVAAGAAAAGIAAMTFAKQPWLRQAGAGAVVGAAVVGAVPHIVGAFQKPAQAQPKPQPSNVHRMAEGDGFVTRGELNDALGKLADSHKETQKQQTCDLLTALRDEIRKVVAEGPNGPGLPASSENAHPPALPSRQPQYTYPFVPRAADGDEYTRNAYGDDIRDAEADEYTRNAYGEDIRDAEADEYTRNAYGEDIRDAGLYDERDADGFDGRDAGVYDERDASVYDERDASVYDERDASVYDERDANGDDGGDYDVQAASMAGHRAM
jgi:hypothetical protein